MSEKHIGEVVQVIGPVLDIRFAHDELPPLLNACLLYTSPSPRDPARSRMPSSA